MPAAYDDRHGSAARRDRHHRRRARRVPGARIRLAGTGAARQSGRHRRRGGDGAIPAPRPVQGRARLAAGLPAHAPRRRRQHRRRGRPARGIADRTRHREDRRARVVGWRAGGVPTRRASPGPGDVACRGLTRRDPLHRTAAGDPAASAVRQPRRHATDGPAREGGTRPAGLRGDQFGGHARRGRGEATHRGSLRGSGQGPLRRRRRP